MSTTVQLLADSAPSAVTVLAGTGLLDTTTEKLQDLQGVLRLFAAVAGVGFVIFQGIASRGAMARILISGLAAGVFVWIVFNVTDLRDRVDNEVNAASATTSAPALLAAGEPRTAAAATSPTRAASVSLL